MQWNELDHNLQAKVIDRIVDLLKEEQDADVVDGIMAAVHELELWGNRPIQTDIDDGWVAHPYFEDTDDFNYRKSGGEG